MEDEPVSALYVHVPFCLGKCNYCDFYSVARSPDGVQAYLSALRTELSLIAPVGPGMFGTVYVGGGTPTVLTAEELEDLLSAVSSVSLADSAEFTIEANPGTLTREKLRVLRRHGVNRLSIGAQSFNDRLLRVLGRPHGSREIDDALRAARDEGFTNVSLDLIFGIPTQSLADWKLDLEKLLSCDVPHVSAYSLTYEEHTPLARKAAEGSIERLGEEEELRMYETVIDTLTENGYEHYEVSNFARPGFACRHNEVYWANESYLGLGPAAASYIEEERRRNVASLEGYVSMLDSGVLPVEFREHLEPERRARETAVMNLRRARGVDFDDFLRHTGFDARRLFREELDRFATEGLVEVGSDSVRFTRRGLMVADSILSELV